MITFHQIDYPHLPAGVTWEVSYFSDQPGEAMFPIGKGYVVAIPSAPDAAQLNFISVPEPWQRQGIGTAIVAACLERWPNLQITSAMSPSGTRLLRRFRHLVG